MVDEKKTRELRELIGDIDRSRVPRGTAEYRLIQPLSLLMNTDGRIGFWVRHGSRTVVKNSFVCVQPWQGACLALLAQPTSFDALRELAPSATALTELLDVLQSVELVARRGSPESDRSDDADVATGRPVDVEDEVPYFVEPEQLSRSELDRIVDDIGQCGLDWANPLSSAFQGTKGIRFEFRKEGADHVLRYMPSLGKYLELVMADHERTSRRLFGRFADRHDLPNFFLLNLLSVAAGELVPRHFDNYHSTIAEWVSVLCVREPGTVGGDLWLERNGFPLGMLKPTEGSLVRFRGDLSHGVVPTEEGAQPRITVVLDSYALSPTEVEKKPVFACLSRFADRDRDDVPR